MSSTTARGRHPFPEIQVTHERIAHTIRSPGALICPCRDESNKSIRSVGERIESMLDPSLFIVAFVDSRDESRPAVTVRRVDSYGFALN